jgi:sterol desaturase/sphingolipid hydroxylase (fatty acid hydroxylase superfamily)
MHAKSYAIIIALMLIFLLEGLFPHYRGRASRVKHAFPHVVTAVMNSLLIGAIAWAEGRSLGLAHWFPLPTVTGTIVVFVLFDVWMFFWHMANHRIAFLWRFHRAHHADIEMDTTTALRFHPGELVLSTFIRLPVVALLGMNFGQLVLFELFLNLSTLFHHSNLAVPERWDRLLRVVIVTPNMHRVHHSVVRSETDSNFTSLLSVWDRLFRTFRVREDTRAVTLGLPEFREEHWQRLRGFLITPLQ